MCHVAHGFRLPVSICLVVSADCYRDYGVFVDDELKADYIDHIYRYAVQTIESSSQLLESKRRMPRIHLEKLERLLVLAEQIGMPPDKHLRSASVTLSEENPRHV